MKLKAIAAWLILVFVTVLLSACSDSGSSGIVGDWQAYGIQTENGTEAYSSLFDEETAKVLNSNIISFKNDGKARIENKESDVSLEGSYEKKEGKYLVKFIIKQPDTEEQMEVELKDNENILIVKQILPKGYEDADPGEPVVYKKIQ